MPPKISNKEVDEIQMQNFEGKLQKSKEQQNDVRDEVITDTQNTITCKVTGHKNPKFKTRTTQSILSLSQRYPPIPISKPQKSR
ncbi:hypothetical protein Lal_00001381 [Lupinus albus]|nr:hypothetical protein Lal_00001381 [Lupinus albus]